MQEFQILKDIQLWCVVATSFPQGVLRAHETLRALLPAQDERKFYGISCPNREGSIVYKAGVEHKADDKADLLKCESLVLKKGIYIGTVIQNFHSNVQQIGEVFQELIANPLIDPEGFCVEVYLNETDVQCMIRLNV